jgi:hypothetical protein
MISSKELGKEAGFFQFTTQKRRKVFPLGAFEFTA